MSININPKDCIDRLFKIKKLQFNTYEIDHSEIKGTLRLINIPSNIMEIPEKLIPPQARNPGLPNLMTGNQTIVAFSNKGKKKESSLKLPNRQEMISAKREDLTSFIIDNPFEPWNEFLIQGNPPILLKTRTILAKLEWFPEYVNKLGDPYLWANHNTTDSVSITKTGESGMI